MGLMDISPWTAPCEWSTQPHPGVVNVTFEEGVLPENGLDPHATLPNDKRAVSRLTNYRQAAVQGGYENERKLVIATITEVALRDPAGTARDAWELLVNRNGLAHRNPQAYAW